MLTGHMVIHIVAMNLVAPGLVVAARALSGRPRYSLVSWLPLASAAQLVLLWGWHLPDALSVASDMPAVRMAMHVSLFLAALVFWRSVVDATDEHAWQALGALLITGKLFCLLGVLITFAPRPLYADVFHLSQATITEPNVILADQHLAGLLMVVACPLSYVLAGIVIAARWMSQIEVRAGWSQGGA